MVPHAVVLVRALGNEWLPVSDHALEMLRMHDVGTRHTPLVGVYSRFGWNHPGPLFLWIDAPSYRLLGPAGVLAWTTVTNAAWSLVTVAGARRFAGDPFSIATAAVLALATAAGGPALLADPWNPWIAVGAVFCCIVNLMAFAEHGAGRSALIASAAGSFAVQAHVGTLPVVGASVAGAVLWFAWARPPIHRPLRLAGAALLLGLVLWSGPLVQQVRGPEPNLTAIARFAVHGADEPDPPRHIALEVAARELGVRPAWAGWEELDQGFVGRSPGWTLIVVPLALAGLALFARRDRIVVRACALFGLLHVVSIVAVTRTAGGLAPYVLRWTWPVGALTAAVLAWGVHRTLTAARERGGETAAIAASSAPVDRRRRVTMAAGAIAAAAIVVPTAATTVSALDAPLTPEPHLERAAEGLLAELRPALPSGAALNVRWNASEGFGAVATGVLAQLAVDGHPLQFPADSGHAVGRHRAAPDPTAPTLWVVGSSKAWTPPPGAHRLAFWSPLTPDERAERDALTGALRSALGTPPTAPVDLDAAERDPARRADAQRLRELLVDGEDYAVYLVPPDA